ncbi:MAG: hypothetical protein AVDCRST_MAG93-2807, partial [uncultured Chloroflexia bacterium]
WLNRRAHHKKRWTTSAQASRAGNPNEGVTAKRYAKGGYGGLRRPPHAPWICCYGCSTLSSGFSGGLCGMAALRGLSYRRRLRATVTVSRLEMTA